MNVQKIAIIAASVLINVLALAGFHALTVATVASATPPPPAAKVVTLPVIHVYPSAAELHALGRPAPAASVPPQADVGGGVACIDMPFYSYAGPCTAGAIG
ncbi:MAG: hypothetical protein EPN38_02885 [Rhodanobacteraceae bacterium]|nr:MAG: hypothetical protein EPN38_02885 [Rhodanobacteraceae bacterium]